jgi:hypothetical protein
MTALPKVALRPIPGASPNVTYCCNRCGSTDVVRDAWAAWNAELQQWEIDQLFDHAFCNTCEGDTGLTEKVIA